MAGVRVVRPGDRVPDVGSGAMAREAAISNQVCGASKIWVGFELPGHALGQAPPRRGGEARSS
jgi:hypothetical protein